MLAHGLLVALCSAATINAQFNLYPNVPPDLLATALNISSGCLTALNTTVSCDQSLFSMAGNVDNFFWSDANATALCTGACMSSASSWWSNCANACADDQLNSYGRVFPAETVPGRFLDGVNIVCVQTDTDISADVGINGTILTGTIIDEYNSTYTASDLAAEATYQPLPSYANLVGRQSADSSPYCLVQSYDWTGVDIVRPDCDDSANVNASQCLDPTDVPAENERIANLYPNDLLCSQCFLNIFYLRLASPYFPDLDRSDYLVDQWFDILDVCNATSSMPDLLVRSLPFYDSAPGSSQNWVDNTTFGLTDPTPFSANQSANATCAGRTIVFNDLDEPTIDYETQNICDVISQFLNTSTGDIWQMFGNPSCLPDFNTTTIPSVCAPLACGVVQLPANTTCDTFAASLSSGNDTITTTQLLSWNPNLIGLCDNTTEQWVCGEAPGGSYISPPASNSTTGAGVQQRGGGNGPGTSTGSGNPGGSGRNSTLVAQGGTPPSPTQSGLPPSCTQYAQAQSGDGCYSFSQDYTLSQQAFVSLNPVLGTSGENCTTEFFAGYWYCISTPGTSTSTATPTISPTASAIPSPVQSGIDSQCTLYSEAVSGDTCTGFAQENNIIPDQLYTWNPVLGSGGDDCGTAFFADYYYCVGVPDESSPPTTSTAGAAGPTQSGIASNCNQFAEAAKGDTCYGFAQDNSISTDELYIWNPVLGPNGADCSTEFFAGDSYCIGVSGTSD